MEQNKDQSGAAVRGEAVAEFNINDMMIVTLTEFGAQIWNSRYDGIPIPAHLIPKPVLAGHVLKDQMWDLMKTFGPHIHLGGEMPFLKAIMAHEKVSARDADAPSEPSERRQLTDDEIYNWAEGFQFSHKGNPHKITFSRGRFIDAVRTILIHSPAHRAGAALDSQPTEPDGLPPLPEPIEVGGEGWDFDDFKSEKTFSCEHMWAYARAAIASSQPTDGGVRNG